MDIEDFVDCINNKDDFLKFLKMLEEDFYKCNWENSDLPNFLKGLQGFVKDIEGFNENEEIENNLDKVNWLIFANILLAARIYE